MKKRKKSARKRLSDVGGPNEILEQRDRKRLEQEG